MSKGKKKKSQVKAQQAAEAAKKASKVRKKSLLPVWLWWVVGVALVSCILSALLPVYVPRMNRLTTAENGFHLDALIPLYISNILMPLLTAGAFIFYHLGKRVPAYVCALGNMVFPALCSMTGCYGLAEILFYGGCAMMLGGYITLHRRDSEGKVMQYILLVLAGFASVLHFVMAVAYGATGVIYATPDVKDAYAAVTAYYLAPAFYFLIHCIGAWKNVPRPQNDAFSRRTLPSHR